MTYVRNIWYAAAWSDEVALGALFTRTFLEEPVLMYRLNDGTAVAISNRCSHRFAPLHMGKLEDEQVECPYHGLLFNKQGTCVHSPHGDGRIPKASSVKSYPLVERYTLLWIWMGDPALADPDLIPDYSFMSDSKNWTTVHGTISLDANYELIIDNLTDLSHAAFVHEGLLETREMARGEFKVSQEGRTIRTTQWCPGIIPPYFFEVFRGIKDLKDDDGRIDHWVDMRYDPPGCMITYYGVTSRGGSRDDGLSTINPNLITPETETKTHYFWADSRNFDLNDSVVTEMIRNGLKEAFETQDKPILEGTQKNMGTTDLWELNPVMLVNDAASVQARRMMMKLREEEAAARDGHA